MPEFLRKLRQEVRFFIFSRYLLALVCGLLAWPVLIYLVDLYDLFFPIMEKNAGNWVQGLLSMVGLLVFATLIYFWIRKPKLNRLAQDVEFANPELKDSLNCAVELQEKAKEQELSFMEKRVLQVTNQKISEIAWGKGTRPSGKFWSSLAFGLICGGVFTVWSFESSPIRKAIDAVSEEPGLSVFTSKSGDTMKEIFQATDEFSRGSDISIFADVTRGHRGEKKASIEFLEKENQITTLGMLSTPTLGRFEFVVPSLVKPFKYRVFTPSIVSDWYNLKPYDPPAVKKVEWSIFPPAYIKQENFMHSDFGYVRAPEGSRIELSLDVFDLPQRVGATLAASDGNHSLEMGKDGKFQFAFTLGEDWKGRLRLEDLDEPRRAPTVYDAISFSPIPDEPPVVEITEPAEDLQLPADAQFLVEVYASDDHGIADVRINISHAGEKTEKTIFINPVEQEKTQTYIFDLNDHALAVGDVLTYMALALDNKEPEGQLARSEIYFIEVLPPEGNATEEMDGEGETAETKEIPIRDFINKSKKIIRSTYDAMLEDDEVQFEKLSLSIATQALSLKHEMTKVFDENEGMFPVVDGIDLGELLNEATYHIEQSEIYAGDLLLEESLEPSEKTLRKLVQLYALLQKMNKKKMKGKGKKPSESEGESEKPSEEKSEEPEDLAEQLNRMAEDLKKLEDLEARQQELNKDIGRAAGQGTRGKPNQNSAQDQEDIRRDLNSLEDDWYKKSGKLGEVAKLKQAGDEMKEAAGDLRRDEPREAQPHGEIAEEVLGSAILELESKMAALAGNMVDQLSEGASGLSENQRELQGETQGASPGKGDALKEEQDELNSAAQDLLDKIDEMARSLGKFNENAMEDLLKSTRESRSEGLERSGKRASNSLLYENFPSAEKEEGKVAENLEKLQEDLEGVANKLRNLGNDALRELVEKLMKTQDELPGMGAQEMKDSAEEIASALGSLSQSKKDERLQNITQFFEQVAISEDPTPSKSMASAAISEALQLAEQFFWKEAKDNLLRRNQATSSAPSRYKRQVEEYFRRIAEGE